MMKYRVEFHRMMGRKDRWINYIDVIEKIIELMDQAGNNIEKRDDIKRLLAALYGINQKAIWKICDIKHKYNNPKLLFKSIKINGHKIRGNYALKCFDHVGSLKHKGKQIPCFEPYNLWLEDLKEIIKFCDEKKVSCHIDGTSPHFIGETIMVSFGTKIQEVTS